jgi:hypothetical protein
MINDPYQMTRACHVPFAIIKAFEAEKLELVLLLCSSIKQMMKCKK